MMKKTLFASILVLGVGIASYALLLLTQEWFIFRDHISYETRRNQEQWIKFASLEGLPFDERPATVALRELQSKLPRTFADLYPYYFADKEVELEWKGKKRIYFGGVPNSKSLSCRESGVYVTTIRDEWGQTNAPGIISQKDLDIVIVGASPIEGGCVLPEHRISSQIQSRIEKTVALGYSSNGPLLNLGAVKEFLPSLKPKHLIWTYNEEIDLSGVVVESRNPMIAEFLDKDYQPWQLSALKEIEPEIEKLSARILERVEKEEKGFWKRYKENHPELFYSLKLHALRLRWPFSLLRKQEKIENQPLPGEFREVITQAMNLSKKVGAKFWVLYLPSFNRTTKRIPHPRWPEVKALFSELGIPVIDPTADIDKLPDPRVIVPFGDKAQKAHLNQLGNKIMAENIIKRITESAN